MKSIETNGCSIHFNEECYNQLNLLLKTKSYSKIFILVDENTHEYCLPHFLTQVETNLEIEIIEIEAGEENKTIETCLGVWETLSELEADRKSLMINIGGGVITDLGGFVACTFKRGISYINVPTSLLSMVDASIGGKTGVDLGVLKNQIGIISSGEMVLIDSFFLESLPNNQFRSGLAEMIKHGLIHSESYYREFQDLESINDDKLIDLIRESVLIKKEIVEKDPFENSIRKTLNFGHTIGHAIESYYLSHQYEKAFLHGEAIAIGMIMEAYISNKLVGLNFNTLEMIKSDFINVFSHTKIDKEAFAPIMELLKFDKKNSHGNINFVLMKDFGTMEIDCQVDSELILDAFNYYNT